MTDRRGTVAAAGLLTTLLLSTPALAVDIGGSVNIGAIYSDNVTLAPDGFEADDFVYRADPTIYVASVGRRYDFRLDYTLEALYYQDLPDSTEVFNQGEVRLDLEVLDEHLFLNSQASISQTVIDPQRPFSLSNVPQVGNRTDAIRYQSGPEWRQDIGSSTLNIRYDVGHVDYDDETVQDSDFQNLDTDWRGPDKDVGLTWSFRHEYRKYTYDIAPDAVRQLAEISLIYELRGGWAPFASGGMESNVRDRSNASLKDGIWRAGLRRETARNSFEVFAGERSFGSTWGARFQQQYGADSGDILRLSYAETPRTNEEISGTLPVPDAAPGSPPVVTPPPIPPDVSEPGSGRFYLSKRGDVVVARVLNRTLISVNVFYEDNETLDETTPADGDDTRQTGVTLSGTYSIGARTRAQLIGYYINRKFSPTVGEDDDDDTYVARVGLDYQLGARTLLAGYVAREERSGSAVPTNNYTENQVGLSIGRTF